VNKGIWAAPVGVVHVFLGEEKRNSAKIYCLIFILNTLQDASQVACDGGSVKKALFKASKGKIKGAKACFS
jgi:hypothetical protein